MQINDRQLSRQKICQKISAIKTNSFDLELFTFDDIKKNSSFLHFNLYFVLKTKVFVKVGLCLLWLLRFSDEFFDAIIGDH